MARAPQTLDESRDADRLEGIPLPRERFVLHGHKVAEQELLNAYRSGRIHHGWILGGAEGIGKSTLAHRFARFVLAHPDPKSPEVTSARDLSVAPDHPVARRILAASHVDLVHLKRPWDDKAKRFKTELTVDEVRRSVHFMEKTSGDGGWRVAIVDTADDMNTNAANALLKVLEEPPARALFLVIAHQPGRLLPTIRSRCRRLLMEPLSNGEIGAGLKELGLAEPNPRVLELSEGSLRRAIMADRLGMVSIADRIDTLTRGLPEIDIAGVHALADKLSAKAADNEFQVAIGLITETAMKRARVLALAGDLAGAQRWSDAHQAIARTFTLSDAFNLDRKAALLSAFRALVEGARN